MKDPREFRQRGDAFSLVELVVAVGITAALAAIMLTIVVNLLDSAQRASGSLVSSNQARVALDFIAQDLESAMFFANTDTVGLAATVQPDQAGTGDSGAGMARWSPTSGGTVKPGSLPEGDSNSSLQLAPASEDIKDYRFGMAGVWLRLFTIEPDSNADVDDYSVMRAVGYQIVRYEVQDGGSLRYGLFRTFTRPFGNGTDNVFNNSFNLLVQEDATAPGGYAATPYNLPGTTGGTGAGDPGNIRRPQRDQLLANNVIDFGVRFWRRGDGGSLTLMFPADPAEDPSNLYGGFAACYAVAAPVPLEPAVWAPTGSDNMNYGYPDMAEIFLRVLTEEGARQIEALERGQISGPTWWEIAEGNSQIFVRRVEMRGKVL